MSRYIICLLAGLMAWVPARAAASPSFLVAAASSLQFALEDLAAAFAAKGHPAPRLVFGSSGNIAAQIARGAPFEVFFSADEIQIETLAASGRIAGNGEIYALGRLAIFAATGSPVPVDPRLAGLVDAFDRGTLKRLAVANPDLAPYGRAAMEALSHAGLGERVRDRLVFGENVAQAAQFATGGAVDAGIFALSLAASPALEDKGKWAIIDPDMHAPIRHRAAIMPEASDEARGFFDFVLGEEGCAILERHGFSTPARSGGG